MAIVTIEECKVYSNLNGTRSIIIDSDRIDECMRVYYDHQLEGVAITTAHAYKLNDIEFLKEHPTVKRLSISDGIANVSGMNILHDLESLLVQGKKREIDFSNFSKLKELRADWSPYFSNLAHCRDLKQLALSHFDSKTNDCRSLCDLIWLESLGISQSSIQNLTGLESYNNLKELELNYCSKLNTLCCLETSISTLESFLVYHCKAIKNHAYVVKLKNLKTLAYNDCGKLLSIGFLTDMRSLSSFRFVGTDILDGNMEPCIGLKYVAFTNKRHFSHKVEQIRELSIL